MGNKFLTFQKFNDLAQAEAIQQKLRENNITSLVENERDFFDPTFANNSFGADINLKLDPADFTNTHEVLQDFYDHELSNVEKDYYLFSFSDEELIEIVSKPDEWGYFDYQLSRKLLKEKGKEINPGTAERLKTQRLKDLARPETSPWFWIYAGYVFAILGGLLGLIIGASLVYLKKTLPNGQRVFTYGEEERNHGTRMLLMSIGSLCFWLIIRWRLLYN